MKKHKIDICGERYGKLYVAKEVDPMVRPDGKSPRRRYECICDCGNTVIVLMDSLRTGNTKSCGCLSREKAKVPKRMTHRKTNTRLYRIWSHMKARCDNPKNNRYYCYGERGIKVCDQWHHSFEDFYQWAMDNGYEEHLTIDRIDCDKGYQPDNCRWVPLSEQSKNRRKRR